LISAAALASAALTVWSVMATTVLERRGEIAIMQATGAADWLVAALVFAEVAVEGAAGGLPGALAGTQLARWVGQSVFHAPAQAPVLLVPLAVLGAIVIALAGAAQPLRGSLAVEPADALRGGA
jgi:ABC-type antimicrobial peptide transport system permease subunit